MDKATDRLTDRQTCKWSNRQIDTPADRQANGHTD